MSAGFKASSLHRFLSSHLEVDGKGRLVGFNLKYLCPRVPLSIKSNGITDKLATLEIAQSNTAHVRKHAQFLWFYYYKESRPPGLAEWKEA